MPIPLAYNLRNLHVRKTTTLMTALAASLSVLVLVAVLALVSGLEKSFEVSVNPKHLILTRCGSTSELVSLLTPQNVQDILSHDGIAKDCNGRPIASAERITIVSVSLPNGTDMNVTLRGMTHAGWTMRQPQLQLTAGRLFRPGTREVVVGQDVTTRCPAARIGGTLQFGDGSWTVVGIMNGGRSAFDSEMFADLNQVSTEYHRATDLSSVLVESALPDLTPLRLSLKNDRRLPLEIVSESEYYQQQMAAAEPVQWMGTIAAFVMALCGAFACMNTMYTAIARRAPEIGILRVLGYSRSSVMFCFVLESVCMSVLGGAIGCLLALPLNRVETALGSYVTWSQLTVHFRVTPEIMLLGLLFAAAMGAAGGLLPARSAAFRPPIAAMRAR